MFLSVVLDLTEFFSFSYLFFILMTFCSCSTPVIPLFKCSFLYRLFEAYQTPCPATLLSPHQHSPGLSYRILSSVISMILQLTTWHVSNRISGAGAGCKLWQSKWGKIPETFSVAPKNIPDSPTMDFRFTFILVPETFTHVWHNRDIVFLSYPVLIIYI